MTRKELHILTEMAGVLAGLYLLSKDDLILKTIGASTLIIDSLFLLTWNGGKI